MMNFECGIRKDESGRGNEEELIVGEFTLKNGDIWSK
jgi:hypothetical protein